jgi:hypothetical protein
MSRAACRSPRSSSSDSLRCKFNVFKSHATRAGSRPLSKPSLICADITMPTIYSPQSSEKASLKSKITEIIEIEEFKESISPYISYSPIRSIVNFRDVSSIVNGLLKSE